MFYDLHEDKHRCTRSGLFTGRRHIRATASSCEDPTASRFPFSRSNSYKPLETAILSWYWTYVLGFARTLLDAPPSQPPPQTLVLILRLPFHTHIVWPCVVRGDLLWESSPDRRFEFLNTSPGWCLASNYA